MHLGKGNWRQMGQRSPPLLSLPAMRRGHTVATGKGPAYARESSKASSSEAIGGHGAGGEGKGNLSAGGISQPGTQHQGPRLSLCPPNRTLQLRPPEQPQLSPPMGGAFLPLSVSLSSKVSPHPSPLGSGHWQSHALEVCPPGLSLLYLPARSWARGTALSPRCPAPAPGPVPSL